MFCDNFCSHHPPTSTPNYIELFSATSLLLYKTSFCQRVFVRNMLRYSNLVSVDLKAGHVFKNGIASVLRKAPLQVRVRSKLLRLFR